MSVTINFNPTFLFVKDHSMTSNEGRLLERNLLQLIADRYELRVSQNLSSLTNYNCCYKLLKSLLPIDYQLI